MADRKRIEKVSKLIEECGRSWRPRYLQKVYTGYILFHFGGGRAGFYGVSDEEPEPQP